MPSEMLKAISSTISVPLDKLKLVHKGRMVTQDNISECVKPKAVFQAIGMCKLMILFNVKMLHSPVH